MALEFLATALAGPIVKHIAKLAFDDGLRGEVAGGTFDWLAGRIGRYPAGKAELSARAIAEQTIQELQPLFEGSALTADQQGNVADALGRTLDEVDAARIVVDERFVARSVFIRLEASRSAARDDLDPVPYGLYQQALSATGAALCRIGSKLPSFQEHAAKATLDALDRIAGEIGEILAGIGRTEGGVQRIEQHLADEVREKARITDENERCYRAALRGDVAKIRLFGLDFEEGTPDVLPLEIAYIPLQLTLGEATWWQNSLRSLEYAEVMDLLPLLGNRLLIEGLGGSGKTTLLQWTALKALDIQAGTAAPAPDEAISGAKLRSWIQDLSEDERTRFGFERFREGSPGDTHRSDKAALTPRWCWRTPFLVRLRGFSDGQLPKPEALPGFIAAEAPGTAEAWVRKTVEEGRALILLDGIDEVPGESRESLAGSIGNYLTFFQRQGNQLVATSRPAAVQGPVWRKLFGPVRASVRAMSPGDVEQFMEHWHRALALATRTPMDVETVDRLVGQIRDRPALTPLAETPLLCAAICYLHRTRRGEIPDRADKLYAQVCEQLVHRLDEHRLRKEGLDRLVRALRGLDADKKIGLLARLAEFMVGERVAVLDTPRACLKIEAGLREINALDGRDPGAVLDALQERSGVLRGRSQDEVEFAHNRLRSYLAARAFKDEEALQQPIDGALATADPDLPVLAAVMGSIRYRERLIGKLLKKVEDDLEHQRLWQITALRCGATGQLSDDLREQLRALERTVLPPCNSVEAAQLAELGPRIVPWLAFEADRESAVDAACVRALRLIGGAEVASSLDGYLGHENQEVLDELAQATNPLRIPSVLAFVTGPDTFEQFWESCLPLRHLREGDLAFFEAPEAVRILNLRGARLSDAGAFPRFAALEGLNLADTSLSDLGPLSGLAALKTLGLNGALVRDLGPLSGLASLKVLGLYGTPAHDLGPLNGLASLKVLGLSRTSVRDLRPLSGLAGLETLYLDYTPVRDLRPLGGLAGLKSLHLSDTQVSNEDPAFQELKARGVNIFEILVLEP